MRLGIDHNTAALLQTGLQRLLQRPHPMHRIRHRQRPQIGQQLTDHRQPVVCRADQRIDAPGKQTMRRSKHVPHRLGMIAVEKQSALSGGAEILFAPYAHAQSYPAVKKRKKQRQPIHHRRPQPGQPAGAHIYIVLRQPQRLLRGLHKIVGEALVIPDLLHDSSPCQPAMSEASKA